jgi:DNA-binding GntR family transcriptional regulator
MTANRIEPLALYQQVAERLRQRIFAHELEPGAWIDEQTLAEQYGISRTPLREALKVLAAEGLVTLKPRRGCYVTEISDRDLDEIFSVMALLEGQCAGDCTEQASDADLAELTQIHQGLEGAETGPRQQPGRKSCPANRPVNILYDPAAKRKRPAEPIATARSGPSSRAIASGR